MLKRNTEGRPSILNRLLAFITVGLGIAAVVISIIILGEKQLSI